MDPLARLRTVRGQLAPQMEARAQVIAERVVTLVVDALDLDAILAQVDLNAVLARVDMEEPIDRIEINDMLARVDLNAMLARVDLNAVIARVDLNAVMDRVDVNEIVQRVDVEGLVEQTDLGSVIASSTSGIASDMLDAVRSRTVGVDESIARWVARLRRRPYTGPPGPPVGLPATAGS